jgi:hypothetical protein
MPLQQHLTSRPSDRLQAMSRGQSASHHLPTGTHHPHRRPQQQHHQRTLLSSYIQANNHACPCSIRINQTNTAPFSSLLTLLSRPDVDCEPSSSCSSLGAAFYALFANGLTAASTENLTVPRKQRTEHHMHLIFVLFVGDCLNKNCSFIHSTYFDGFNSLVQLTYIE